MIIVDFEIDPPILRATREAVPGMSLVIESEQAPGGGSADDPDPIRLLFWASGGDYEALEAALEADPTVTDPKRLADAGDRRLYRVVYTEVGMSMTAHPEWVELDGEILDARTTESGCAVRMRFPDRESVAEFKSWFDERDLPFRVTRMFTPIWSSEADGSGPSEKQREALVLAWERGYFDVPRDVELSDLAADLGISDTALSQRLRRGMSALVELGLVRGSDGEERLEE